MRLIRHYVEKPWGRTILPAPFHKNMYGAATHNNRKIGEIWFDIPPMIEGQIISDETSAGPYANPKTPAIQNPHDMTATPPVHLSMEEANNIALMSKYLFTSERLSIQVHPNDKQAREKGHSQGKEECWYILDAEPGAVLGIGLNKKVRAPKLRAAASSGAIEHLVDWKEVKAGDFFYIPAGTIHAIGAGISLIEVQQRTDITYRLYDYGRPRQLHLNESIEVAHPGPYDMAYYQYVDPSITFQIVKGPYFELFHIVGDDGSLLRDRNKAEWHILPIEGIVMVEGEAIKSGESALASQVDQLDFSQNGRALVARSMP